MSILLNLILMTGYISALNINSITDNYFETPGKNAFQLNILPEYELERYIFSTTLVKSEEKCIDEIEEIMIYRMPAGPKSPRADGKRPALIEHGIFCNSDPCVINRPQIAIAYILVDQGYDVWLGVSNSNLTENTTSSMDKEKKLQYIARYIFSTTYQAELSVMGYFNGSVQLFGIITSKAELTEKKQSKIYNWLEYIPGVKTVKKWYQKGKNYLTNSYDQAVKNFNFLGEQIDIITNDSSIREFKQIVLRAWGVVNMVVPTLSVNDFSEMIDHPDIYLDTPKLIRKYGYPVESHVIETEDGYLLTAHRIPGYQKYPERNEKPVVLLQHGILSSSADWIIMGPSNSLGYLLANEGYDVWLGNSRGNTYSKGHVKFSTSETKFWDFSWHEMGIYDLPATIDYILAVTNETKIFYVGHSQGSTTLFVLLSEKPEYNNKIAKFIGYAPIAYMEHIRSPIVNFFAKYSNPIYSIMRFLQINDFLPTNALLTKVGRDACEARSLYQVVCSNTLFMVTGYNTAQINKTMIPVILGHVPAGSSIKQLAHYGQEYNSKKFQQFDYGSPLTNVKKYGTFHPPEYNIKNIKIPVAIFYANNDLLADSRDIQRLANELQNLEMLYKVPLDNFNHIDFLFAVNASKLVYQATAKYIGTVTNESYL